MACMAPIIVAAALWAAPVPAMAADDPPDAGSAAGPRAGDADGQPAGGGAHARERLAVPRESRAGSSASREGSQGRSSGVRGGERARPAPQPAPAGQSSGDRTVGRRAIERPAASVPAPVTAGSGDAVQSGRASSQRVRGAANPPRYAVRRPPYSPSPVPGWGSTVWTHRHYRNSYWAWTPSPWGLGYWTYYDPWFWGPPAPYGYGAFVHASGYAEVGAVRLRVRPREAEVYVDGYYVGIVDEFDGTFQRLRLEEGPHQIEVRHAGFEPLEFKVYVVYDRTLTLRGELQPAVP
jgi:hypothetical protein